MKKKITLKLIITFFVVICSAGSLWAQNWGAGVKLGDPTGITVKKYNGDNALELIVGYPSYWYYNYDRHFSRHHRDANWNYYRYDGRGPSVGIQLRYLKHNNLDILDLKDLKWYWGVGGQLRTARYYYVYDYWVPGHGWRRTREAFTSIGIGPDGILGMEYTFREVPFSIFLDGNLYLEIVQHFHLGMQVGFGGRYNF